MRDVVAVGMRYFIPEKDAQFFETVLEREGVSSDTENTLKRSWNVTRDSEYLLLRALGRLPTPNLPTCTRVVMYVPPVDTCQLNDAIGQSNSHRPLCGVK